MGVLGIVNRRKKKDRRGLLAFYDLIKSAQFFNTGQDRQSSGSLCITYATNAGELFQSS